jgi:hypothetical protein
MAGAMVSKAATKAAEGPLWWALMPILSNSRRSGSSLAFPPPAPPAPSRHSYGGDDAAELCQHRVARRAGDPSAAAADQGIDDFPMGRESGKGRGLVALHMPAEPFDIGRKDRNELALEIGCFYSVATLSPSIGFSAWVISFTKPKRTGNA